MKTHTPNPLPHALALCLLLLIGCAEIPDDLREEARNGGKKYGYCISVEQQKCFAGTFTASTCNGQLSDDCPYYYNSQSSSSLQQSSSSVSECESIFNPSTHFCYNRGVYPRCNGMEYNPTTHICQGSVANPARCNGTQYNPLELGCCLSAIFDLANQRCQNDAVETKCGTSWYNSANQRCENNVIETKCGNEWYNVVNTNLRCQSDVVETKCGTNGWYNPINQRCENNAIETKCGTSWYDATNANLRCQSNVIETKCGTNGWYNPINQRCGTDNVVETKCQSGYDNNNIEWYDSTDKNLRCQYNAGVQVKCGTDWIEVYNIYHYVARCQDGVAEYWCHSGGGGWYNPVNQSQRCGIDGIEAKCGTNGWYNPINQRCGTDNVVETKCGSDWYNSATHYCKNGTTPTQYDGSVTYFGQTYNTIVIGDQTWIAENLNYNATGSKCYNNEPANCDKYGRLYDWSTAMGLASSCNSSTCNSQISAKHKGICPSGWHIPSNEDWNELMAFIHADKGLGSFTSGTSSYAGTYLKAVSGWYSYSGIVNLDSYGFSALPGGYYDYSNGYFRDVGGGSGWLSSSENDSSRDYGWGMFYGNENAYWYNDDKSYLRSVRCVMD